MTEQTLSIFSQFKRLCLVLARGVVEFIFYVPVLLTMAIYFLPQRLMAWWLLGLLTSYMLPHLLIGSGNGKKLTNWLRVLFVVTLGALPNIWMYPYIEFQPPLVVFMVCWIVGMFIVDRSIRSLITLWRDSFDHTLMLICLFLFIVLQVLKVFVLQEVGDYELLYNMAGMLAFVLFMYIANERLVQEQHIVERKSATRKMSVRQNRVLITILVVIVVSISLFRQFQQSIEQWLLSVIRAFIAWITSLGKEAEPIEQEVAMPPAEMDMLVGDQEQWLIWHYLSIIMKYVAFVGLLCLVLFLFFKLSKKLSILFKWLFAKLFQRNVISTADEWGYIDEIEELQAESTRSKRVNAAQKVDKRLNDAKWRSMSNEDRIRTLYRLVVTEEVSKGYSYQASATPAEIIQELGKGDYTVNPRWLHYKEQLQQLLEQYEQSRYGQLAPTEEILQSLYSQIMKKQ